MGGGVTGSLLAERREEVIADSSVRWFESSNDVSNKGSKYIPQMEEGQQSGPVNLGKGTILTETKKRGGGMQISEV